jgi:hypothetical protein
MLQNLVNESTSEVQVSERAVFYHYLLTEPNKYHVYIFEVVHNEGKYSD